MQGSVSERRDALIQADNLFWASLAGINGAAGGERAQNSGDPLASAPARAFVSVSEVPIPAALPLFMAGLAGFDFAGWRKRKFDAQVAVSCSL